jgi:hypothetical protein
VGPAGGHEGTGALGLLQTAGNQTVVLDHQPLGSGQRTGLSTVSKSANICTPPAVPALRRRPPCWRHCRGCRAPIGETRTAGRPPCARSLEELANFLARGPVWMAPWTPGPRIGREQADATLGTAPLTRFVQRTVVSSHRVVLEHSPPAPTREDECPGDRVGDIVQHPARMID